MNDELKLAMLRVQLYTAAQQLKGDALGEFTNLIREVAVVLEVLPSTAMPTYEPVEETCP